MRQRLTIILAVTAALACGLSVVAPVYSGRITFSYAGERRVIRAGVLTSSAPTASALFLLSSESVSVPLPAGGGFEFYPPRPPGWEIINPIAVPGVDKSDPAYWTVGLGGIDLPLIQNFDLLILPVDGGTLDLTLYQQRTLERWVDEGGLLWIDYQPGPNPGDDPQLGNFFLRPPVLFTARNRGVAAPKAGVDLTSPLLRGRLPLSEDEVQLLGQQYAYGAVGAATNAGVSPLDGIVNGVNNPFPPNSALVQTTVPQEVVGELYDNAGTPARTPVIAAGYYGDGSIVASACGVLPAISDWFIGLSSGTPQTSLELPQWAIPDMKLAYNMVQWWMDWAAAHGRTRFRGEYREELPGPPVVAWSDGAAPGIALSGPAIVARGLAFAGSSTGVLGAWDADPFIDRDLDGRSDDGFDDYSLGAATDLLWWVGVPWQDPTDAAVGPPARSPADPPRAVVGSPAVATTYDGTGPRRLVAVAVRTDDALDSSIHAYLADARDAQAILTDPSYPEATPVWSATIKHYSVPNPEDSAGVVNCGPVAVDRFFALITNDSGTLDAPNRDAHLLVYDAAGPGALPPVPTGLYNVPYEQPAFEVAMAEGGRAATFANPPAIGTTTAWDEVARHWEPVQAAVIVGNSLPRPGPSATGRLWVTPAMVRFPAPGWDRTWLIDPSQPDTAVNQAVTVTVNGVQVPPYVDDVDDGYHALNYVRRTVGGQIRLVFTRWSLFGTGEFPLGSQPIEITYRDTAGATRTITQKLHPGFPVSLGGYVSEAGYAAPCVFQEDIFVGTDAVNAYPSPSSEGRIALHSMGLERPGRREWTFVGDHARGQVPTGLNGSYFSSYSYTPAHNRDTLFAVGNYEFFHHDDTQVNDPLPNGPSGALYALNLDASTELVNPGTTDPVLGLVMDAVAPRNDGVNPGPFSADPNQVVQAGRSGAAVWLSTRTDPTDPEYDSPRYAIPQVAGTTINWRVDFENRIIRLGGGVFGDLACPMWSDMGTPGDPSDDRYVPQQVRVRYFSGGALVDTVMEVRPLVKWLYLAPDGWEFVSSPVLTNSTLIVAAYDRSALRYLLLGFRAAPDDTTPGDPLWAQPVEPEYIQALATGIGTAEPCGLAVTENGLVWSANLEGSGTVAGALSPATVIADNDRLLAVDPAGRALTSQDAAARQRADSSVGVAGVRIQDSYAERMFESFDRPRRVRPLPNGNRLVVDSGVNQVFELGPAGDVVWRYPNDDPDADLGGMTAEEARLLAPADAQRYSYQTQQSGATFSDPQGIIQAGDIVTVDWATTLIADAGNSRVIEVARPLLDGRYRPEVTDTGSGAPYAELVRVVAGPSLTTWPTAAGTTTTLQASFVTASRFAGVDGSKPIVDATYPYLSANIICGVGNSPSDPLGPDKFVRLVEIGVTHGAGAAVTASAVAGRVGEGINVFRPRVNPYTVAGAEQFDRDFMGIRQADLLIEGSTTRTLIVDDVGVKLVDNATWNATLTPVFEMRGPAPWLHDAGSDLPGDFLTTYEEEIVGGTIVGQSATPPATRATGNGVLGLGQALTNWVTAFGDPTATGVYPPLISEPHTGFTPAEWDALRASAWGHAVAYAQATADSGATRGEVPFLPFYAQRQRNGKYLIVNAYPTPYASEGPLDILAPTTSEVLEVDPAQPVGQRIVTSWDPVLDTWNLYAWNHFMVPDPARSEYPLLRGGAGPLRQPWSVERR
jgi:hypothetical protein